MLVIISVCVELSDLKEYVELLIIIVIILHTIDIFIHYDTSVNLTHTYTYI